MSAQVDPHTAERLILIGCHEAASKPYALRLHLSPGECEQWFGDVQEFLNESIKYDSTSCAVFIEPQYESWPETRAVIELVRAHYAQARINQNTVEAIGERQGRNFVRNLRSLVRYAGEIRDACSWLPSMAGRTAIVCGAGPSFEQSADLVAQHTGPIIAVNTSAGACAQRSVHPHVVVCTESKLVREGIERMNPERAHFAMDMTGNPGNWWDAGPESEAIGSGLWLPQLAFIGTEPNLAPYARSLGMLPIAYGSSCTTAAVSLALACGAARVVLVGQDCAFAVDEWLTVVRHGMTGWPGRGRMYASGTPYEETTVRFDWRSGDDKPGRVVAVIDKPTVGVVEADTHAVPGIGGDPSWTTPSMLSFAHWFRDQPVDVRARVVNCTAAGVRIEGIEHSELAGCIERGERYRLRGQPVYNVPEPRGFEARCERVLTHLERVAEHGLGFRDSDPALILGWAQRHPILNMWLAPERLRMRRMEGLSAAERGTRACVAIKLACAEMLQVIRGVRP